MSNDISKKDDIVFQEESKKLTDTVNILRDAYDTINESLSQADEGIRQKLRELRDSGEGGQDLFQEMAILHEQNEAFDAVTKTKKLEELAYLIKEPYFARIDLKHTNEDHSKPYYIGKFGHTEDEPLIIDWRAKLASVFYRYRYPQKNVEYNTPGGLEVRDLTLKRTFEVSKSELHKYYNNDLQLDENEIISEKIEQRTGGVLEDIIETIQEGQLDIIEADPRQVCIVQGTVGSGKSTVAIHKLAHIFFNYESLIKAHRSILIAKNQILVGYLSTLFPKLGIFDIQYGTLKDMIIRFTFREKLPIKIDLDRNNDLSDVNLVTVKELKEIVKKLHEKYENEINDFFSNNEFESYGGYVYDHALPITANINEIIEEMDEEISLQKEFIKDPEVGEIRKEKHRLTLKMLKKVNKKMREMALQIRKKDVPDAAKEIGLNLNETLGYKEGLIYFYIYSETIGFDNFTKYDYCVVDEAQDFNVLEYLIMGKIVQHGRFSILGDLNQAYSSEGLEEWENILQVIDGATNAQVFQLDTNYRSTKQIINFANRILSPYTDKYLPKPIERHGAEPVIREFSSQHEMLESAVAEIQNEIQDLNKSIGVIAFDESLIENLTNKLKSEISDIDSEKIIFLNTKERVKYAPRGVYVSTFANIKGLEFSKVIVLGLNLANVGTFLEAKRAFVAITRAMNELEIYYAK